MTDPFERARQLAARFGGLIPPGPEAAREIGIKIAAAVDVAEAEQIRLRGELERALDLFPDDDDEWVLTYEKATDESMPCLKPSHKKMREALWRYREYFGHAFVDGNPDLGCIVGCPGCYADPILKAIGPGDES